MANPNHDYTHQSKTGSFGSAVTEKASELADKATQQVSNAVEGAENTVRQIAEQGSAAGEQVQEIADNVKGAVGKSLKDQPMMTLAVAAIMGFALGALWKS